MKVGTKVIYKKKIFQIFHVYNSGYYEIKEVNNNFHVELVHNKEIIPV